MNQYKKLRRKKLIEPRIQLRFGLLFLSLAMVAVLVQSIVIVNVIQQVARRLPNDGVELTSELPFILAGTTLLTLILLAPLSLVIGIRSTFPLVGPLYRFRAHLGELAAGRNPGPCRIRKTDELQDLCVLINEAMERIPGQAGTAAEADAAGAAGEEELSGAAGLEQPSLFPEVAQESAETRLQG